MPLTSSSGLPTAGANGSRKDVERLKRASENALPEPTESWITEQLSNLSAVLSGGRPAAAHALSDLVGGKIYVKQIEQPDRKRHFLQGRFSIRMRAIVTAASAGNITAAPDNDDADGHRAEFLIDFVDEDPRDELAENVKRLYDDGLMCNEIAKHGTVAQPSHSIVEALVQTARQDLTRWQKTSSVARA